MNQSDVTIIVPIYNLKSLRFNNFCFLVKQLDKVGCSVIVAEQKTENTQTTEQFLVRYENVSHLSFDYNLDKINKSRLINDAVKNTFTEFVWMVDCDFYTDYSQVILEADGTSDFIRPFSEVVMLNKEETYQLHASGVITNENPNSESNTQDGKFSFIVRVSEFNRVGGMNEDFEGWGFQDLDFVENRLGDSVAYSNVNLTGYHMYHTPASRKDVNINRKLYVNYKSAQINEIVSKKLKEYGGKAVDLNKNLYTDKSLRTTKETEIKLKSKPTQIQRVLSKWKSPTFGIVYSSNKKIFYPGIDVITVKSTQMFKLKNVNGTLAKVNDANHFLFHYFEYITYVYEILNKDTSVLFVNDSFCKNTQQIDDLCKKLKNVEIGKILDKESIGFTSLYEEKQRTENQERYSALCCFLVKSDNLLKNDFDFYYDTLNKMKKWSIKEYNEFIPKLKTILT